MSGSASSYVESSGVREDRYSQVLLSLLAFEKRTQKTPPRELQLAQNRLRDWRTRGQQKQG